MNKTENKRHLNGIDIVEGKVHSPADMVKWFTLFATRLRHEAHRDGGTFLSEQRVYNAYLYANSNTQIDC